MTHNPDERIGAIPAACYLKYLKGYVITAGVASELLDDWLVMNFKDGNPNKVRVFYATYDAIIELERRK